MLPCLPTIATVYESTEDSELAAQPNKNSVGISIPELPEPSLAQIGLRLETVAQEVERVP